MTDSDRSDFNRHKAVNALEEVPLTDDRHEARRQALEHLNAVPIGVLEDLVERWERAKFSATCPGDISVNEVDGVAKAADELQEIITEYGDPDE